MLCTQVFPGSIDPSSRRGPQMNPGPSGASISKHLVHRWAVSSAEIIEEAAIQHQSASSARARDWLHTLPFWIDRSRQLKIIGELADLDNHLLNDIGV